MRRLSVLALLVLAPLAPAAGQRDGVRLYTDDLGVTHVFADTDAGVFRGLGYSQVRDFPVATLANLWSATGRFAEVAGPLVLARDLRCRQWGFDTRARELAEDPLALDAEVRGLLQAYVDGVNEGRRRWLETEGLLARLVGEDGALAFDPVPQWLHPQRSGDDPLARLRRLFALEVGLEHVLALGLTLAAGPEFGGGGYVTRTNVWAMRSLRPEPRTFLLADVHQPLQEFGYRSYFVQLAGPRYDLQGHASPGMPCVLLGASRELAFAAQTLPGKPRELARSDLAFRYEGQLPVVESTWRARLEADAPARVRRGEQTLALVEREVTLRSFDVARQELVDDPRGPQRLRWVHDGALGLDLPVVEPRTDQALELGAEIRWQARAFLGQRSVWESWIRLGLRAPETQAERALLAREGPVTGRGQSLLCADVEGNFSHRWSTRAPILSAAGRAALGTVLDGSDPQLAWGGFHPSDAAGVLTGHGNMGGSTSAWIQCNSTPHFLAPVEGLRLAGPPEVCVDERWRSRRQERARELFERANEDQSLSHVELERMALDVQDQWSRASWPWLQALGEEEGPALSARARAFLGWIRHFRFERPDGKPGAAESFLAHPLSQVMPWMQLLRGRYEDALIAARAGAEALELAFDPLLEATTPAEFLAAERYEANRATLRAAVEWAAELRERTLASAPGGLLNAAYLRALAKGAGARLFPAAWDDALYSTQAAEWSEGAPPVALRWGQVNVYALTPHRWPVDPVLANARQVEPWLASIFAPATHEPALAFFRAQPAVVFPSGGTHDSLFQVHREGFGSLARSLIPRGEGFLALAPIDFGSQALFLAELVKGARPTVHVLPALGGTELLVALPEFGTGALELFRPTARFARGEWSRLANDEAVLGATIGVRQQVLD